MEIQMLENEGVSTDIARDVTYSTIDSYTADLLHIHDSHLHSQPNAVNDVAMLAVLPVFVSREFRRGALIFPLTDLHQSNILACSLLIKMIEPPYWLTGKGMDQIDADEYNVPRSELIKILALEEAADTKSRMPRLSKVLAHTWATGTFWVTLALSSPSALFTIFRKHIYPQFVYAPRFVIRKVTKKETYDQKL
ncbi:hypothetical protein BJX99DRAFT_248539 [Aspergillus californicus]